MWDQPIPCPPSSPTILDRCGFFNSVVVRLSFNSTSDGSEWWLFYNLVVILMWLCKEASHVYLCCHLDWKSVSLLELKLYTHILLWLSLSVSVFNTKLVFIQSKHMWGHNQCLLIQVYKLLINTNNWGEMFWGDLYYPYNFFKSSFFYNEIISCVQSDYRKKWINLATNINSFFSLSFLFSSKDMLIDFRRRGRQGEKEGEKLKSVVSQFASFFCSKSLHVYIVY